MPVNAADKDLLATAKARMQMAMDAYSDSRESELDDLRFFAASPDNPEWQWPQDVLGNRGAVQGTTINARPCLVINKLPQHVKQVTNDQKQNRPSGKVIPVDDNADIEVAEILNGIIRHVEYISDADVAYDTACDNQVSFGEGYFRVLTEYVDENSFDQEIKIGRIRNSFSVYMDPQIQDPAGSDAQWCFISQDILKEDFEREFPKATPISTWMAEGVGDQGVSAWLTAKTIRIAEYFYFEDTAATLILFRTPQGDESTLEGSPRAEILKLAGFQEVRRRPTTIKKVKWCKLNGFEVLDKKDWPGKWIPVVRVVGNEFEIDGRIYISGLIRNAKDAQRMYNYWASQEAEMLALAPKAPFIGYAGQFEGYETDWTTANTTNHPYLQVNPDVTDVDGKVLPKPERSQPPMLSTGILQAKMGSADDIKGTTGQYDPTLGAESNEKSGKAIIARERQSDTGTYHYVDNLAKAIRFGTRQIIDLVPKIYDTQRIARIIGVDGEVDYAEIDPQQPEPIRKEKDENGATLKTIYNPSIGKYDVMATTGPNYMTKRQETASMMVELSQGATDPTAALLMRYFAVKNMDFPEAQEFAGAVKKLLPEGLLEKDEESPELVKAKQVIEQMQQQMQSLVQGIQQMQQSFEAVKSDNDTFRADIDAYKAETERVKVFMDDQHKKAQTQLSAASTLAQIEAPERVEQ